jgi:hypothetical protein
VIANARLFWILAGFFVLAGITYVVWTAVYNAQGLATQPAGGQGASGGGPVEWVGTVGLFLTAILSAFIAFYLGRVHSAQGGELPEDRLNANIDDGDAEQGFFSPWSWWPLMLGGSAALLFLGIVVGTWIIFIAIPLTLISLVGWTYEYYRGNFGR